MNKISLTSGVSIAVSMVIGSGLFGLPGLAIQNTSPSAAFAGWLIVVLLMPAMIHIFCKLSLRWNESGGIALYASKGLGEWSKGGISLLTFGTLMAGMPAFFLVGASYICELLGLHSDKWIIVVSILLASFTTLTNISGRNFLSIFNKFSVVLVLLVIFYILTNNKSVFTSGKSAEIFGEFHNLYFHEVWLSASIVFWAFQGWENMTFGISEIESPSKNIPRVFWYSFILVSIIYVLFSYCVSASFLDGHNVMGLSGLTSLIENNLLGKFVICIMVVVLVANANSWVYGSSRAYLSSLNLGLLPKLLSGDKTDQPSVALYLASLFVYSLIIFTIHKFSINVNTVFLATTQGFIILYGASILAFIRYYPGLLNRVISLLASVSWIFLMSGFGSMIFYSLGFFLLGVIIYQLKKPSKFTRGTYE